MNTLNIKTGDTVIVLSGKDKGKQGKVIKTFPAKGTAIVEGIAVTAHHTKPRKQGETGGIIDAEGAIYASKVALYCSKCGKGVRAAHKIVDGKKVRVCAKCGQEL